MPGTYTADELRSVRILIPDTEDIYGESEDEFMFEDADLALYLDMGKGSPMWAAGLAMIAVGNSEALIGKVIRNYETETDASKLQKEWRTAGIELVKQARAILDEDSAGIFEVAYPDWSYRHPEGYSHGGYRGVVAPSSWQW